MNAGDDGDGDPSRKKHSTPLLRLRSASKQHEDIDNSSISGVSRSNINVISEQQAITNRRFAELRRNDSPLNIRFAYNTPLRNYVMNEVNGGNNEQKGSDQPLWKKPLTDMDPSFPPAPSFPVHHTTQSEQSIDTRYPLLTRYLSRPATPQPRPPSRPLGDAPPDPPHLHPKLAGLERENTDLQAKLAVLEARVKALEFELHSCQRNEQTLQEELARLHGLQQTFHENTLIKDKYEQLKNEVYILGRAIRNANQIWVVSALLLSPTLRTTLPSPSPSSTRPPSTSRTKVTY